MNTYTFLQVGVSEQKNVWSPWLSLLGKGVWETGPTATLGVSGTLYFVMLLHYGSEEGSCVLCKMCLVKCNKEISVNDSKQLTSCTKIFQNAPKTSL